jgi:hypothetical protein
MMQTRSKSRLVDLLLIVALCGLVMGAYQWLARLPEHHTFFIPLTGFVLAFFVWRSLWRRARGMRTAPTCPECGRRFLPNRNERLLKLCPQCRQRTVDPITARKARAKGLWALLPLAILLGVLVGFMVQAPSLKLYSSSRFWFTLVLVAVATVAAIIAVVVAIAVILLVARILLSRSERYVLAAARESADEPGTIRRLGPVTFWWSGADDPVPMLTEQMELARNQFDNFMAEKVDIERPLRVLCFSKRSAFVHYHRNTGANFWNLDGLYVRSHVPAVTLTTDCVAYKLNEPARIARSLFAFHCLSSYKGSFPPFWLLHGVGNSLSNAGCTDRLEILNRKMTVALAQPSAAKFDLFNLKLRALSKLMRNWYDQQSFSTLSELIARSWSLVEYLRGPEAPAQRREQLRTYLKELPAKGSHEPVFERHFGLGFQRLAEEWRQWVRGHGLGSYAPPPAEIQSALLSGIIPTVQDGNSRIMERIQAVREIGRLGYCMGADALIDLLRTADMILIPEIIWSLQQISGHPWGHDVDRWKAWLEIVPPAAVRGEH